MSELRTIAALWGFDRTDRYPPQFVGAIAESLRDSWWEEGERLRKLAEQWFSDFDDEVPDRWTFEVCYTSVDVPAKTGGTA